MEETVVPNAARVLMAVGSALAPRGNETAGAVQTALELVEGIRLISCVARFKHCYEQEAAYSHLAGLCTRVWAGQLALSAFGGGEEAACDALLERGDAGALLRAIAEPLHGLVSLVLPWAAPPGLGNAGTRFDFEYFFQAHSQGPLRGTAAAAAAAASFLRLKPKLTYPDVFSPGRACAAARARGPIGAGAELSDVRAVLARLAARGVPPSNFVVNFGAADGECGAADDWNADPANCLAQEGAAAVLFEGDPRWHGLLRERYGHRTNISMALRFMPLSDVATTLRRLVETTPGASREPDLLKVDVDHADCLFMEEALRAVQPKLVHLEYQPMVPPPLGYVQRYQSQLLDITLLERVKPLLLEEADASKAETTSEASDNERRLGVELPGCSMSASLARAQGYELLAAGPQDLLLLRRDLVEVLGTNAGAGVRAPSAEEAWFSGAFCYPLHLYSAGLVAWGFDFRLLADASLPAQQRLELFSRLLQAHGAAEFELTLLP
eukprot:TRINITY_DN45847_c0_g1_i1.p1 TRINITY_DN45847_c0_g1~~TRINITY_DN45847_c0_g1_i1.p1  ORF type:complete len:576 (-),score=140.72 TRINITY_DN45847_c0_g1_i1:296-1786(-)